MSTPKPPTPTSVSATLRAADFKAYRDGRDEGYITEWSQDVGSPVHVIYRSGDPGIRDLARQKMADVLRRKGWAIRDMGYLVVKER